MSPRFVVIDAFAAVSFAVLGVVALLLPSGARARPPARHLGWLGVFGLSQCAVALLSVWTGSRGHSSTAWGMVEALTSLPVFEYARRIAADRAREVAAPWRPLTGPWLYLPLLGVVWWILARSARVAAPTATWASWLIASPSALVAGLVVLARARRVATTRRERWVARALAVSFVSFGLVNGLGVELSSGIRPALESTDGWFGVAAIAVELVRAMGALVGALSLGWLVGREMRDVVARTHEQARELREVLGSLEARVAKRTDELSRANDELAILRYALDSSLNAFCISDLAGRVQYVNPAFARLWQLDSPADAIGRHAADFAASREQGDQVLAAIASTGGFDAEVDVRGVRGRRFPARVSGFLVRAPSGTPIAIMGALLDVSEVRETAAALEREREFARRLLGVAPALVVVLTNDGLVEHVNPAFERLTGYRLDEVRGKEWLTFLPERDRGRIRELFRRAISGIPTRGNVNAIVTRAGEERQIEWHDEALKDADGGFVSLVAVGVDVTERLAAEQRLRATESRNQQVLDSLFGYVGVFELDGTCIYANRAPLELAGLQLADVMGKRLWETYWFGHDAHVGTRVRAEMEKAARGEAVRFEATAQVRDGALVMVDFTFGPVRDERGEIAYVAGFGVDVTERVQASAALHEAVRRNQALLSMSRRLEQARGYSDVVPAIEEALALELGYTHTWLVVKRDGEDRVLWIDPARRIDGESSCAPREIDLGGDAGSELRGLLACTEISVSRVPPIVFQAPDGAPHDPEGGPWVCVPVSLASRRLGIIGLRTSDGQRLLEPTTARREYLAAVAAHVAATLDRIASAEAHSRAERAALEHESRYRRLHDSMMDAFVATDMRGVIVDSNRAYREMLGYTAGELARLTYVDLTPAEWHGFERSIVEDQVVPIGHSDVYEKEYRRKDGTVFPIELRTFLLRDADGVPSGMWAIVRDITARKRAQEELRRSEMRLRLAQKMARMGSWELDIASGELWWSDETYRLFGLDRREFTASYEAFLARVHPDDRERVDDAYRDSLATRSPYLITHRLLLPDGRLRIVDEHCETEYSSDGTALRSRGTVQDVSDRVAMEELLRRSVREKEILLREIHHRVKNNLQIISSVLHFQAKKVHDPRDLAVLNEGRDRLRSMILVHQQLYRADDLSRLDFADYARSLVHELLTSHAAAQRGIEVRVMLEPLRLSIDQALPCGMVICELLTNVFKYAFPRGRGGLAEVRVRRVDDSIQITVADDGVGLPADFEATSAGSFGWQLVRGLARQVNGTISIAREVGTAVTFTSPIAPGAQP